MPALFTIDLISVHQPQARALIALHLLGMRASSPPDNVFALDLSGYDQPSLSLWGALSGEKLAGMIALKRLDAHHGEIKSMRTHPDFLRQGVARLLLDHLIAQARADGIIRLSLETGSGKAFEPALALYRMRGFANGPAFGDYVPSDFSQYLHLALE